MKKLMLISNRLPDETGGRAESVATRMRLLEDEGWETTLVHVPTVHNILPINIPVTLVPGISTPPILPGIVRCWRRARKEDIDVFISMNNPPHLHLVGLGLSFLTDVPWIAEFRDPLVEVPSLDPRKDSRSIKIRSSAEKMIVKHSDQIVWGDGIQMEDNYFERKYPEVPSKKFHKLPFQGFESEKFDSAGAKNYNKFTITYAGSFYEGWREPYRFLDGVSAYLEEEGNDIRVQFYGDWNQDYQAYVEQNGLEDVVVTHDRVTHNQIIPVLKGSDILLYLGGDDPNNRLNVPSKVYDYIGARRPILAVVDPSFRVADVMRDNELGVLADPAEPHEIADSIRRIRSGEFEYAPDEEVFDKFKMERKMEVLAEVLDAVKDGRVYDPIESEQQ